MYNPRKFIVEKEVEELQREVQRMQATVVRMKMQAHSEQMPLRQEDVKALEGWLMSMVEGFLALERELGGSLRAAGALDRFYKQAMNHIDWPRERRRG